MPSLPPHTASPARYALYITGQIIARLKFDNSAPAGMRHFSTSGSAPVVVAHAVDGNVRNARRRPGDVRRWRREHRLVHLRDAHHPKHRHGCTETTAPRGERYMYKK